MDEKKVCDNDNDFLWLTILKNMKKRNELALVSIIIHIYRNPNQKSIKKINIMKVINFFLTNSEEDIFLKDGMLSQNHPEKNPLQKNQKKGK